MLGLWAYLFLEWKNIHGKWAFMLSGLSGVTLSGVFFGWLWQIIKFPFNSAYINAQICNHVVVALVGGFIIYAAIKKWLQMRNDNDEIPSS
jgi:cytochrome bd-type quinol oxidase subunit 2